MGAGGKVSIVPRGPAGGVTQLLPSDDEFMETRKGLLASLRVSMGGRAAEELIFGQDEVTSGATNDIQTATRIAMQMVQVAAPHESKSSAVFSLLPGTFV